MAVLSKTGITNNSTIQASHITQSIDALTGQVTNYDIVISGSLGVTGSLSVLPANTPSLVTALFTVGQSDNNFKAGFANGSGSLQSTEHAKVGMWYNATVNYTTDPVTHIGFLRGNGTDGAGITFNINNTEYMRITSSGNVIITGSNFEVRRSDDNIRVFYRVTGSNNAEQHFMSDNAQDWVIGQDGKDKKFKISSIDDSFKNSNVRLSIDGATGNVGIGTTSSLARLDVSGSTIIRGAITSSGAISSSAGLFGTTLVTTGAITSSGAISSSAGLFSTTLLTGAITASAISASSDITAPGMSLTKTGTTTAGSGQLYLNGSTNNRIDFNNQGVAIPSFTNISTGTKIVLYPAIGPNQVDYAIGIAGGVTWFSVPSSSATYSYKFYASTSSIMELRGDAILTLAPHTTAWPPSTSPPPGSLAMSGSGTAMRLMYYNGTSWNTV